MDAEKKNYMKIIYRPHLRRRLKEREIPKDYPKKILQESEKNYLDTITDHSIAIKRLRYNSKLRNMVIAYDIIGDNREIVTIYPISESELLNRIRSERWKIDEKN